ncbi:hypothetical protein [Azospirillum sp.]|uniref:hypothetical protein n=1 Tax=Azospirillum sp. TaxID=34012 RepID=UPI002D3BBF5F|nr:hypothetical protein [Azospirillum sp.]HYD68020.1 hypothetical protein [Azospirillum sp.]
MADVLSAAELAGLVLKSVGGARVLVAGGAAVPLVRALLLEGVDAHGVTDAATAQAGNRLAPGRFRQGSPAVLPVADGAVDTLIVLDAAPEDADALAEWRRVARASLFIAAAGERTGWEARAFDAGWRRHPLWPHLVPAHDPDAPIWIETPGGAAARRVVLLETVPEPHLAPPEPDGLRANDAWADAAARLWHLAAEFVGADQRVLVAPAGAGWGAAILARRTQAAAVIGLSPAGAADYATRQYACGDPRLFFPAHADGPFDVMVAVAPPDPAAAVAQARRSVRPGGRLVLAVPVDGPAVWPAVRGLFDDTLAIDRQFFLGRAPAAPAEISPDDDGPDLAGWAMVVAVVSPFAAIDPALKAARAAGERFHVRAWWRDYDNPYVVETLVNLGSRVHNPRLLQAWTERVLTGARPGSADQGAALCVQAYRLLERGDAPWDAVADHLARVARWLAAADATAHARRWRASLHYVTGQLRLKAGDREAARTAFAACAAVDVRDFSATLGTKTVSACLKAGHLALASGEPETARAFWRQGMAEANRLLQGDWSNVWGDPDRPFWVETREAADVVDLAMECATALGSLPVHAAQPSLIHEKRLWGRAGFHGRIDQLEREQVGLRTEVVRQRADALKMVVQMRVLRGAALLAAGHAAEAERFFAEAERRDPAWGPWLRALTLLGHGLLAAGWAAYDRRFALGRAAGRDLPLPAWRGEDIADKRILVWREQGLGDELMFASLYPDLIARAGHVALECDPRLTPLFTRSFPAADIRPAGGAPDGCDLHVPAGTLPRYLRPTLAHFPDAPAPLVADPARVSAWRRRLAALGDGLKVGLSWRGRRGAPSPFPPLDAWAPLLALDGVQAVSLQYDPDDAEVEAVEARFGVRLHRFPDLDLTNDLDGLAALMSGLDLVLTVPTSVGDLAAALGVAVWRGGWDDDWAMLGTGRRPWYPSMRLFLAAPGDGLDEPIRAMTAALEERA